LPNPSAQPGLPPPSSASASSSAGATSGTPSARLTAGVFVLAAVVYIASPVHVQADSLWSIPTAISILREGNTNLDEYRETYERTPHGTIQVGPHVYPWYPLAVSLVALPFVALMEGGARLGRLLFAEPPRWLLLWDAHFSAEGDISVYYYARTERFIASLCTALAVALFFRAARRRLELVPALLLTGVLAFGTGLWSTASRVLWQHGPSAAVLAWVVFLLTRERPGRAWEFQLGLAAGLAYVLRPTNALTALGLLAYVGLRRPRGIPTFALGAAVVAVPFCAFNLSLYGALLPPYFRPEMLGGSHLHFLEALAGNLVSPSRGLFIWTPVVLLGLGSALGRLLARTLPPPETWMLAVVLLHWLSVSLLWQWWGGHSVGPRFFTDVSPYLFWLLVFPLQEAWTRARTGQPARRAVLLALGLFGVFTHGRGATQMEVHAWNDGPPAVDTAPRRVWDWGDVQFLRGL
jgi:hypothetical protein